MLLLSGYFVTVRVKETKVLCKNIFIYLVPTTKELYNITCPIVELRKYNEKSPSHTEVDKLKSVK